MSKIKITLLGKEIENYCIVVQKNSSPAEQFAGEQLRSYLYKMTGCALDIVSVANYGLYFSVDSKQDSFNDGFEIKAIKTPSANGLKLTAKNGRGIIYAVYELLERMGYRFFSSEFAGKGFERGDYMQAEEFLFDDTNKVIGENFYVCETPAMYYRDAFSFASSRNADYLKFRLNAETWGLHRLREEWGGGHQFRGAYGHSFAQLLPSKVYFDEYPEFFAEIDGKRVKNDSDNFLAEPQLCLTNKKLVNFIADKMINMIRERYSDFISLSQSDSHLFCQCETCRKSYEKYGYFGTLLRFVNPVAEKIKAEFPNVKVHTYCYERTADANRKTKAADNVMVQYCPRPCHRHSLSDEKCLPNVKILKKLRLIGDICKELFIYDYRSCLGFSLFMLPDIHCLKENMRCFAEAGVKGIYSESNIFTTMQPTMEELRLYLFGKLTWNPFMSDDEYNRHINEFLEGFYGKGWKYMREFIDFYEGNAMHNHIDSFDSIMMDENGNFIRDEDGNFIQCHIFAQEKEKEILQRLNDLLDMAQEQSGGTESRYFDRIEIVRTGILWYELYSTMHKIIQSGSEEEKKRVIAKNEKLCRMMRKYQMKYTTFISMNPTTEMYGKFDMPTSDWKYCVNKKTVGEAFNATTLELNMNE